MKLSEMLCTCDDTPIHPIREVLSDGQELMAWVCDECDKYVCAVDEEELKKGLSPEVVT